MVHAAILVLLQNYEDEVVMKCVSTLRGFDGPDALEDAAMVEYRALPRSKKWLLAGWNLA